MKLNTPTEAYGEILDLISNTSRIIIGAKSSTHPLTLPVEVVNKLVEANEALKAAHRELGKIF